MCRIGSFNPGGFINSRNCLGGVTIIFGGKMPFMDITQSDIYCTVWTPMLGEAMLQVACGYSNIQY